VTGAEDNGAAIVLAFSDGTYVAIKGRQRHDDVDIEEVDLLCTDEYEARHAAVKAGVWTNEEEIAQKNERLSKRDDEAKSWRRQQFERLKREFDV